MPKKKKGELEEIAPGILKKNDKTYYIVCKISGKHCYCNADRLQKLADKFGGMDKIQDHYVSRDAKRLAKTGMKEKKIKELGADAVVQESKMIHKEKKERKKRRKKEREEKELERAKIPITETAPSLMKDEIIRMTSHSNPDMVAAGVGGACIRPRYFLDNRNCGLCTYLEHCKAECKVVKYFVGKKLKKGVATKSKKD